MKPRPSDYEANTLTAWLKAWAASQAASSLSILIGILHRIICIQSELLIWRSPTRVEWANAGDEIWRGISNLLEEEIITNIMCTFMLDDRLSLYVSDAPVWHIPQSQAQFLSWEIPASCQEEYCEELLIWAHWWWWSGKCFTTFLHLAGLQWFVVSQILLYIDH